MDVRVKEEWAPKNWCCRTMVVEKRLLRVPWTAQRSNQSVLREINPEYSLEELMLKLKLQYFHHLMWRASLLEKTLMLWKIEGRRRQVWQRIRWLDGITYSVDMKWADSRRQWRAGKPDVVQLMRSQGIRHNLATEHQQSLLQFSSLSLNVSFFNYIIFQVVLGLDILFFSSEKIFTLFCIFEVKTNLSLIG